MFTVLVVIALLIGASGLVAGLLALITLGRLRRGVGLLGRGANSSRESFIEASARHAETADRARTDLDAFQAWAVRELDSLRAAVADLAGAHRSGFAQAAGTQRSDLDARLADVHVRLDQHADVLRRELEQVRGELDAQGQADRDRLAADNSAARDQVRAAVEKVEKVISTSLRRTGLVRYDAFDDLGGRLSFSLAVLDSRGDGMMLTSLAGRSETRVYAKPIAAGAAATELSPEESQAVAAALAG